MHANDVVGAHRLYPRAPLTPCTDDVLLTGGDKRTYTGAARAQRNRTSRSGWLTMDGPCSGQTGLFVDDDGGFPLPDGRSEAAFGGRPPVVASRRRLTG